MKEWDTYITTLSDLAEDRESLIIIRDLTPGRRKYRQQWVRARVSPSLEKLGEGDKLWLRFPRGQLHPEPWFIKIIEELKL